VSGGPMLSRDDRAGSILVLALARRPDGIFISSFEQGEIGPDLFRAACNMGLEGLVSKRRDRPYQSGRSKHWMKVKNRRIRR
jgi:bifunctional non-homologous end joining protein LigD